MDHGQSTRAAAPIAPVRTRGPGSPWRGWWLQAPYAAAAVTVPVLLLIDPEWAGTLAVSVAMVLGFELLGLGLSVRAATHPALDPAARRPWKYLVAFFLLVIVHGALAGAALSSGRTDASALFWLATTTRLAQVPVLLLGLLSFAAEPLDRLARRKIALDVTTVVGGGAMLMWYFLLSPALASRVGQSTPVQINSLLFPVCDLVLILAVSAVLLRGTTTAARRSVRLMLAGVTAYLVADVYMSYQALESPVLVISLPIVFALAVPRFLMAAAAAEACRQAAAPTSGRPTGYRPPRGQNWLPTIALTLGYALLAYAAVRAGLSWVGLVVGAIVMTVGVAGRQLADVREKHVLVITDSLTGLANRVQLRDDLSRAVERSGRTGQHLAVLLLDLDGFKKINDRLGHDAGDALLVAFADVLRRNVRESDTAARLGGDEFAVILGRVSGPEAAVAVARRILADLSAPVVVNGGPVEMRASIGVVAEVPPVGGGASAAAAALLHRADTAMYVAKRQGAHGWHLYSEAAMEADRVAADLSADLANAVDAGQLRVVYQPIVGLAVGGIVAVEALVRWEHPTRGLIPPADFISLAEDNGAIHDIGRWVLEQASCQARQWQDRLPEGRALHLSVNVSARQFERETLAEEILEILHRTGLDPRSLVVEVTESAVVDDQTAVPQLMALRARGVRVALDDFGTGYSSLRYLTQLPVDILKLDRCFVAELNGEPKGSAVAEAVIRLAQVLRLDTVAEGIEEPTQAAELLLLGYRNAQGFHFARPLSAAGVDALIDVSVLPAAGDPRAEPAPQPA